MSRVASGGELARIMLAIKNVMAERDAVPTLIFDEVDAGVSGRAAQRVAEKLASVAKSKQVLCVTHLPQIAAMADCHLRVSKSERAGRTYTAVEPLARRERELELARLIGWKFASIAIDKKMRGWDAVAAPVPDRKRPGDGRARSGACEITSRSCRLEGRGVPPACVEADGCARYGAGRAKHAVRAPL